MRSFLDNAIHFPLLYNNYCIQDAQITKAQALHSQKRNTFTKKTQNKKQFCMKQNTRVLVVCCWKYFARDVSLRINKTINIAQERNAHSTQSHHYEVASKGTRQNHTAPHHNLILHRPYKNQNRDTETISLQRMYCRNQRRHREKIKH